MGRGWRVAQSWRKEDLGEEEHGRVLAAATPKFSPREILGHKIPIIVSKKKVNKNSTFFFHERWKPVETTIDQQAAPYKASLKLAFTVDAKRPKFDLEIVLYDTTLQCEKR